MTCGDLLYGDDAVARCGLKAGRYCEDCEQGVCSSHWVANHLRHQVRKAYSAYLLGKGKEGIDKAS